MQPIANVSLPPILSLAASAACEMFLPESNSSSIASSILPSAAASSLSIWRELGFPFAWRIVFSFIFLPVAGSVLGTQYLESMYKGGSTSYSFFLPRRFTSIVHLQPPLVGEGAEVSSLFLTEMPFPLVLWFISDIQLSSDKPIHFLVHSAFENRVGITVMQKFQGTWTGKTCRFWRTDAVFWILEKGKMYRINKIVGVVRGEQERDGRLTGITHRRYNGLFTVVCSKVFKQTSSVVLFIFIGLVRLRSTRLFPHRGVAL